MPPISENRLSNDEVSRSPLPHVVDLTERTAGHRTALVTPPADEAVRLGGAGRVDTSAVLGSPVSERNGHERILSCSACSSSVASLLVAQRGEPNRQVEWLYYGGDPGGMKYSTLTDINPANIQRLQKTWEWKHWETPLEEYGTIPGFFEATPLMIDGVLYVTTPYNSVAALDAETGKELWRFDGEAYKQGQVLSGSGYKLRGTSFWRDGGNLRIFLNSRDRLFMLDAKTGKPVPSFGNKGEISLNEVARIAESNHVTQAPARLYKDLAQGSQIPDRVQIAIRGPGQASTPAPATRVGVLGDSAVVDARRRLVLSESWAPRHGTSWARWC